MAEKLLEKAEMRLAAAKPILRSLDSMKSSALRLKEIMDDPKKRDAFHKTAAETLGVNFN